MTRIQMLEREVQKLDRASLVAFRNWFQRFDYANWNRQIARDVRAEKLEKFAAAALDDHKSRKTREL